MNSEKQNNPPRWADKFLELYCNPKLLEQIQGDVHELYYWRLEEKGARQAKGAFCWDILRFCRWRNIKRSTTQQQQFNNRAMLKNYFKIGWRNLLKQKLPSFINIFGLATAIACCMVAYLFIEGIWLKGMYHENKDEIYMVTYTAEDNDGVSQYGSLAAPLANSLNEFSSIKNVVRINNSPLVVGYKNENFRQFVQFVDPNYMDVFTHTIISGTNDALKDPSQVILTEWVAQKFFGSKVPIGEEILLHIKGEEKSFTVGAVVENQTAAAMFHFDILINNTHLSHSGNSFDDNWQNSAWTFVQIPNQKDITSIDEQFESLVKQQNEVLPDSKYLALQLEPFMTLSRKAQNIRGGAGNGASLAPQIVLSAIGGFLLILAVFNYINIAILMATRRIKEIGIRKVIGSKRSQLVFQFLSENMITCFISITMGLIIAYTLFIPWFNDMATTNLRIDLITDPYIYLFLGGLLIFITLTSGAYPAFYISSFQPLQIFSGKQRIGSKGTFTSVLLTFQFILAIITIVAGASFVRTNSVNQSRDWGYDNSDKIVINIPNQQAYIEIKNELKQHNQVLDLSGSTHRIGNTISETEFSLKDEISQVDFIQGNANYPELMGLRLAEGRLFNKELSSDISNSILVNRKFMNAYNLKFPVQEAIEIDSIDYNIIGVVEDFHSENFAYELNPVIISATPDSVANYLTIKVNSGEAQAMAEFIKALWHEKVNGSVYDGHIQAEIFDFYFFEMRGLRNMMIFTATLAVILSAMGLFGLVSLSVAAKMKDISIRKVLGATMMHLSKTVLKKYLVLWLIGCTLGLFLAYMAINALLESVYSFHAGVGFIPLIFAMLLLLVVIIITISSQLVKVKRTNPVDTLRTE